MQYNDLSNKPSPTIAFRLEDFLLEKSVATLSEKLKNVIKGNYRMSVLNEDVARVINHIFRNTDMNSYVIADIESKLNQYELDLLETVHLSELVYVRKPVDVTRRLMTGEYSYYIDRDIERMSLVNHKNCLTLAELNIALRG